MKQEKLIEVNHRRQANAYSEQQYRFYQTTNEQGADIIDELEVADTRSLWQKTQENLKVCNWFRRCCRRE